MSKPICVVCGESSPSPALGADAALCLRSLEREPSGSPTGDEL